jgi:hypothetical protein
MMSYIRIITGAVIAIGVDIADVAVRGTIPGTTLGFMVGIAHGTTIHGTTAGGDGIFTLAGIAHGIMVVGILHGIDLGITVGTIPGSMVDGDTVVIIPATMAAYMLVQPTTLQEEVQLLIERVLQEEVLQQV